MLPAEFSRSRSNRTDVGSGSHKFLDDAWIPLLQMGSLLTPQKHARPTCYPAKLGLSKSNGIRAYVRRFAFLGHSCMVIGADTDRSATYDFLLVIQ